MKKFNKDKYLRELKIKRFFRNNSRYFYIVLSCLLCCFLGIYFTYSKFFISEEQEVIRTTVGDFRSGDVKLIIYVDGKKADEAPQRNTGYSLGNLTCTSGEATWSDSLWQLTVNNITERTKCSLYFVESHKFEFVYTGNEQKITISKSGIYKLEVWGAQGGDANNYAGGTGGYSYGTIRLNKNDILYINVGGGGSENSVSGAGGYNGGGTSTKNGDQTTISKQGSGGGATHIATKAGLLVSLESNKDNILIVAGGGGGADFWPGNSSYRYQYGLGGVGGGYQGGNGTSYCDGFSNPSCHFFGHGGTQIAGGSSGGSSSGFGKGGNAATINAGGTGGGGGYYGGGGSSDNGGGGGGSGYIGNSLLNNKIMYCYNCTESSETDTKTVSTTCNEETPTENCAKKGNGYARITYLENVNVEYYADNIKIDKAPNSSTYNFNKIDCQNGSNLTWNNDKWEFAINDYQENDTCKIYFSSKTTIELAYTGAEEKIAIPKTGFYKLETWGAAGGSASSNLLGGSGGYSAGVISLSKNDVLYVNIGGGGNCSTGLSVVGGYNGGGAAKSRSSSYTMCSGGGATSITKSSGLLSSFSSSIDKILMVAGGGGGSSKYSNNSSSGGSGGGINGVVPTNACTDCGTRTGGSQTAGGKDRGSTGTFGQGGGSTSSYTNGGGGGYYGGGGDSYEWGATGGSGYIGNSLLKNKSMYCYNCPESSEESTKTITTTCNEEAPTENCAKKGNGYAKITYVSDTNLE